MARRYERDILQDIESMNDSFSELEVPVEQYTEEPSRGIDLSAIDLSQLKVENPKKKKKKSVASTKLTSLQIEQKNKLKKQKLEFNNQIKKFNPLNRRIEEIEQVIYQFINELNIIEEKLSKYFVSFAQGSRTSTRVEKFEKFVKKFYMFHDKILYNQLFNQYLPTLIDELKEKYFEKRFDDFLLRYQLFEDDVNYLDKSKFLYKNYINLIFDTVFTNLLKNLFNELYEIFIQKNELFDQLKYLYQQYKIQNVYVARFDLNLFYTENYKLNYKIKDYFKNIFQNINEILSPQNIILKEYFQNLKINFKLPFELQRRESIRRVRQLQEIERRDRKINYDQYLLQQESKKRLEEKLYLEKTKGLRLEQARKKFSKQYQNLSQEIERQFEELSFQRPESKYNKFINLMDPTYKLDPEIPNEFLCPISGEIMIDPVVAEDGNTYERRNIENWFKTKMTSPLTGLRLKTNNLYPNTYLKKLINDL